MAKTDTSSVDEEVGQDTAPSEKSASQTPPEITATGDEKLYLTEEMDQLPDLDLVKIGLVAMAILHKRASAFDAASEAEAKDD